jgi:hypothetical protein
MVTCRSHKQVAKWARLRSVPPPMLNAVWWSDSGFVIRPLEFDSPVQHHIQPEAQAGLTVEAVGLFHFHERDVPMVYQPMNATSDIRTGTSIPSGR